MKRKGLLLAGSLAVLALLGSCNQIAGIRPGDPLGSPIDCDKDSDCPASDERECSTFAACEGGTCSYTSELDGKVIQAQIPGDCSQRVCDGKGGVRLQAYDADVEDDGQPCSLDTCEGGLAKHTLQQEVPCYSGGAGTAGVGRCKQGIQHCDESFQPIGGCEGEIVPQAESCLTPGDEDCDGKINEEGEACVCQPDSVSPCYEGLQGTAGVGVCKLGTCLCNGVGTACLSACSGQVLPAVKEDCSTPADEDCDGKTVLPIPDDCAVGGDTNCDGTSANACTGALGWVKASSTSSYPSMKATSITTDAAGNLYATGMFQRSGTTTIDLGGGPLTPPSQGTSYAAYLVKLAPDGKHLWSKVLPCANTDEYELPRLAVAAGQVALAYTVENASCDFGSGSQESTAGIALVRLDADTGSFVSKAVIGNSSAHLYALAAGSSGVYLAGYQYSSGMIGGVSLSYQPFVAKVDGSNSILWVKGFAMPNYSYGGEDNRVTALAVLPEDAVAFAGNAERSTIDLGAGPVGSSNNYENAYFGVLEPGGALRWGKVFGPAGSACCSAFSPSALVAAPNGDLIALGRTDGGLQLGEVAVASDDGYVVSLAAASGAVPWAKTLDLPSSSSIQLRSLSVDALGHIGIGSFLTTGSNLGGGPVTKDGTYVTKLDKTGVHLWSKPVPLYSAETPLIASAKDAGMLFTGLIYDVQSFDGTMVGQSSRYNAVFSKLAP